MLKHILKLIKNQRGSNAWVFIELFLVFVLLWRSVDSFLIQSVQAGQPDGFSVEQVYKVTLAVRPTNSPSYVGYEEGSEGAAADLFRIVDRLKAHPDIEAVSLSTMYTMPYTYSSNGGQYYNDTILANVQLYEVMPDYFRVFDIRPSGGQEIDHLVKALSDGLVISRTLEEELFGQSDATGRYVKAGKGDSVGIRITAVTTPVRKTGSDQPRGIVFKPLKAADLYQQGESDLVKMAVCFRTRPGVAGSVDYAGRFKREMKQSLTSGNFWLADVQYYPALRATFLDNSIEVMGRKVDIAVNLFLLANVFLAVIGTFWFRVNRRRGELGLRMAVGSSRRDIRRMVVGEGLLLLTVAAVPALLICLNIAYLDMLDTKVLKITAGRLLLVSLLTWGILASIITLAVWYPARKASRLEPADALHYE